MSQKSIYFVDLPCVATIYLLVVIGFRVYCMGFLKIRVLIAFMAYDSSSKTDTHIAKFFPGVINI